MNLDRLLVEKIENRILVGIVCFVGIMVIIGWVAINEPARMQAFSEQFEGRSIERGAKLFNQNCATCHGVNGYGINGRAPALNSPHLFGHDFFAAINREADQLQRELDGAEVTEERAAEIQNRLDELELERQSLLTQLQPAIDLGYDPDTPNRLTQVEWGGSLRSYVLTTLVHGRPGSAALWPNSGGGMVAWGQTSGGPLREDQLENLTDYIMNWNKDWTIDDLLTVEQFAKVPVDAATANVAQAEGEPIGTDVDAILADLPNYTPDPINGQAIYNGVYACAGCHGNEVVAPLTELTWQAALDGAGGRPHAGDPERYVVESIVNPGAFVVSGYPPGAMPGNFGERITGQELADILAYLRSYAE